MRQSIDDRAISTYSELWQKCAVLLSDSAHVAKSGIFYDNHCH